MAPAISSAVPKRLIGVCANITFSISGVNTLSKAAVLVAPGPTALIRTSGPKSWAKLATVRNQLRKRNGKESQNQYRMP